MRVHLTLLRYTLPIALWTSAVMADTDGVGYMKSKDEEILNNYVNSYSLRVDLNLFHLHEGVTDMYGISPGVGYRLLNYQYFRLYGLGHLNAGITISPKTELPPCPTNIYDVNNGYPPVDDQIDKANNQVNSFDTKTCNSTRNNEEALSGYGGAMYYDLGLEPTILLFNHISLNAFGGYRWPHGSHYGNIGDLDVHGPTAKLGLSLEF